MWPYKDIWRWWNNTSEEIEELHAYGITRIYSPDDGRRWVFKG